MILIVLIFDFQRWSESDTVSPNPTILQVYVDISVSIFAGWQGWKDHVYLGPGHLWGGSSKLRVYLLHVVQTVNCCCPRTPGVTGTVRSGHTGAWSPLLTSGHQWSPSTTRWPMETNFARVAGRLSPQISEGEPPLFANMMDLISKLSYFVLC